MTAIELDDVHKSFGDVRALRGVDLEVEEGEVFGFLGPNGAGKSTTINILLDFVRPDQGDVRVLDQDAGESTVAVRERTGVLPEGFDLYKRLTAREHLRFAIESMASSSPTRSRSGYGFWSESFDSMAKRRCSRAVRRL